MLGENGGTILCDRYFAYESLETRSGCLQLAHCWAHVRPKFLEWKTARFLVWPAAPFRVDAGWGMPVEACS